MSDFAKCQRCGGWKSDGKCNKCSKLEAAEAEAEAKAKKLRLAEQMQTDMAARQQAVARGEKLDYDGEKHDVKAEKEFEWKFDFSMAPLEDISANKIDWPSALGCQRSAAGTEGVIFVAFESGAVVVKCSSTIGSDMFSTELLRTLGVDLQTAGCRALALDSDEGKLMMASLTELDNQRPTGNRLVATTLCRKHAMIMEYMPGEDLDSLTLERARQIFGDKKLSPEGVKRCMELGGLMGLDMLINNMDRLPLLWDNNGNAGNVMFSRAAAGRVLVIDNLVSCINPKKFPENYEKYFTRVQAMLSQLRAQGDKEEMTQFAVVREMIKHETSLSNKQREGLDIGSQGTVAIQRGLVNFVHACLKLDLTAWRASLEEALENNKDMVGSDRVDVDFIATVVSMMGKTFA